MTSPTIALDARLIGGTSTGDSTYWTGLLHGLREIDADARFLLYSNAPRPEGIPIPPNFRWIVLPARSARWWSYVAFPLAARRAGADVLHTQYSLSPLAKNGITTVHDVSFFIGPDWFKPRDRMILTRTVPAAARRAKAIVAVSETDRGEIEQYVPESRGKIRVTYNACPPWIDGRNRDVAAAAVERELGVQRPYLLTVGTRWPRKNMELAVAAADLLPEALPHRLVVTGKVGWGSQELGQRGQAVGYVSNAQLGDLYSAANLYLCPSRHEGFGIPLLEAFRCGCPVLSSTGGALPEVAGGAAEVIEDWTPEAWAWRIAELLQDGSKLEDLRRRGRERERAFSWAETARKTIDIYMEVLR